MSHYSKVLRSKGTLERLYNMLIPQILRQFMCVSVISDIYYVYNKISFLRLYLNSLELLLHSSYKWHVLLKEQSWLTPFLIFPTGETEPAKPIPFPSASKNLLFPRLHTYHDHSVLSKSHFLAPSEGKNIFQKISYHSGVLIGSVIYISVPFGCFCMFHSTEMEVFRVNV